MELIVYLIAFMQILNGYCYGAPVDDWDYKRKGEDFWPVLYSQCAAYHQSPINIITNSTEFNGDLKAVTVVGADTFVNFSVVNKGETVKFAPYPGQMANITFSGSDFTEKFQLLQFHFHWGWNDYQGSEHQINFGKYPVEMHFVTQSPSGKFAVFGFLFKLSQTDNPSIVDMLASVPAQNYTNDTLIRMNSFLPSSSFPWNRYFRYDGSLTTPPCSEGITWNVFSTPIPISHDQLQSFRKNIGETSHRNPQQLFNRTVYRSYLY